MQDIDISELREIAEEAKETSALYVKPVLERLIDRLLDTLEDMTQRGTE